MLCRLWECGDGKCLFCSPFSHLCKTKHNLNFRHSINSRTINLEGILNPTHYTTSRVFVFVFFSLSSSDFLVFTEMIFAGDWIITLSKIVALNLRRGKTELQGVHQLCKVLYVGIWALVWRESTWLSSKFPENHDPQWPTEKKKKTLAKMTPKIGCWMGVREGTRPIWTM